MRKMVTWCISRSYDRAWFRLLSGKTSIILLLQYVISDYLLSSKCSEISPGYFKSNVTFKTMTYIQYRSGKCSPTIQLCQKLEKEDVNSSLFLIQLLVLRKKLFRSGSLPIMTEMKTTSLILPKNSSSTESSMTSMDVQASLITWKSCWTTIMTTRSHSKSGMLSLICPQVWNVIYSKNRVLSLILYPQVWSIKYILYMW